MAHQKPQPISVVEHIFAHSMTTFSHNRFLHFIYQYFNLAVTCVSFLSGKTDFSSNSISSSKLKRITHKTSAVVAKKALRLARKNIKISVLHHLRDVCCKNIFRYKLIDSSYGNIIWNNIKNPYLLSGGVKHNYSEKEYQTSVTLLNETDFYK